MGDNTFNPARLKSGFFDKAARYSFGLALGTPFIAYLIIVSVGSAHDYLHQNYRTPPHFLDSLWDGGFFFIAGFYFVSAGQLAAFLLGLGSLFGKRSRPASFWLAFIGALASAIVGMVCYSIARHGISMSGC